jgi:hypothetical protein
VKKLEKKGEEGQLHAREEKPKIFNEMEVKF